MILLIDNYDSFSYNLVQLIGELILENGSGERIEVVRNDEITLEDIEKLSISHIILSPGPGRPVDAGICEKIIKHVEGKIKILGICLGHQAICEVYGAVITYAKKRMHGKQSIIQLNETAPIFKGLNGQQVVGRYHSLAAESTTIPNVLQILATDEFGEIMAVKHREYDVYGLQFHPESILTPNGKQMMRNFIESCYTCKGYYN